MMRYPEHSNTGALEWVLWLEGKIAVALLLVYLFFLYTLVPLEFPGGQQVPGFWVLPVMCVYAVLFGIRLYKADVLFLANMLFIAIASLAWAGGLEYYKEGLASIAMLFAALVNGIVFTQLVDRLHHRTVSAVLLYSTIGIMIGTVLEVSDVMRNVSDAFRVPPAILSPNFAWSCSTSVGPAMIAIEW